MIRAAIRDRSQQIIVSPASLAFAIQQMGDPCDRRLKEGSMTARLQMRLKTISGPGRMGLVSAPPIFNASDHTIDFTCARCGVVLMRAEEDQVHNLAILCTGCGSYNSTD
jgi:predicted RNA-binding Zn-ribbon protein involved in translation (DUF1610 family)